MDGQGGETADPSHHLNRSPSGLLGLIEGCGFRVTRQGESRVHLDLESWVKRSATPPAEIEKLRRLLVEAGPDVADAFEIVRGQTEIRFSWPVLVVKAVKGGVHEMDGNRGVVISCRGYFPSSTGQGSISVVVVIRERLTRGRWHAKDVTYTHDGAARRKGGVHQSRVRGRANGGCCCVSRINVKGRSVMEILNSGPSRRLFQTAEEVKAYLKEQ